MGGLETVFIGYLVVASLAGLIFSFNLTRSGRSRGVLIWIVVTGPICLALWLLLLGSQGYDGISYGLGLIAVLPLCLSTLLGGGAGWLLRQRAAPK